MNKAQLVDVVSLKTELKKKDAEAAVDAVVSALTEALASGDKVQLFGFGSFEVKERPAREGHNPMTGAKIQIAASKHVAFASAKALKDKVNG